MLREVFKETKSILKGKRLMAYAVMAMYMIVGSTLMSVTMDDGNAMLVGLFYLLLFPLAYGLAYYFYNMTKGTEKLEDLIEFYIDYKTGLKLILAIIWYMLIVCIGFILLIVPGLIWTCRYAMFMFFIFEDRNITIEESFKKSAEMMKGYKFKYFLLPFCYLLLPFIVYFIGLGMIVTCVFTNANSIKVLEYLDGEHCDYYDQEYNVFNNGDGTVTLSFNPAAEGTYQISEDDNQFTIIVDNKANEVKNEVGYVAEEYDGKKYISVIAEEDGYELIEEDGKVTVTVNKNATEKADDNKMTDNNPALIVTAIVLFIIGLLWVLYVAPDLTLAEVVFYNKLKEKN